MKRPVTKTLLALALGLALFPAPSASANAQVGKAAVVRGTFDGPLTVRTTLRSNDALRVCISGEGVLPIAVGQWRTADDRGSTRRNAQYVGEGCSRKKNTFAAGTVVRYRACFADPRTPRKLLCGKWRKAKAA